MFCDPSKSSSLIIGRKTKIKRPCSKRRSDVFFKVEVRDVGAFLLTFPFASQPDFSLTCFLLSPGTILNQYSLKIEVEVVLTCSLVKSWVWGKAVLRAGHSPSRVGWRWGQGEGIILHIVPLSSLKSCCQLERGSGNEKTHTHIRSHMYSPLLLPWPHPLLFSSADWL